MTLLPFCSLLPGTGNIWFDDLEKSEENLDTSAI